MFYSCQLFEHDVELFKEVFDGRISKRYWTGVYGVPRGGVPFALRISGDLKIPLVDRKEALGNPTTLVVDDIIDSGTTRRLFPNNDFVALHKKLGVIDKLVGDVSVDVATYAVAYVDEWVDYWWEGTNKIGPEDNIRRILQYIGEDPGREGLLETPTRVVKSYGELFSGYKEDPAKIFTTFDNTEHKYDQIVLQKNIPFFSTCEHHLLPFSGQISLAYIPKDRIVGLSKLARLVEVYARRLQVQERLGEQIVGALMEHLKPLGAACHISAQHLCMQARGVAKHGSTTITQSIKGVFIEDTVAGAAARAELSHLLNGS